MKKCISALWLLLVCAIAGAIDIQLNNGTTYRNAVISGHDSDGIEITAPIPDGFLQRRVRYSQLTPQSYAAVTAAFYSPTGNTIETIRNRFASIRGMERMAAAGKSPGLYSPGGALAIPGVPHDIQLDALVSVGNGTIGWAHSVWSYGPVSYGRIYVDGIYVPWPSVWNGTVYPTNKTISWHNWVVPCFATTPEAAIQINNAEWW